MGEIADSIINGEFDQYTGEYIGEPSGYPRTNDPIKQELEPKRVQFAIEQIKKAGYSVNTISKNQISFEYKGAIVHVFPYTGWFTGKTVKDGRGIFNLLKQIKKNH